MHEPQKGPQAAISDTAELARLLGNLNSALARAIARDYQRPEIQADYKRWKSERARQAAGAING